MLSRLSDSDRFVMMADGTLDEVQQSKKKLSYSADYFTKALQCAIAESLLEVWKDPRFVFAPAQIVHPVSSLAGEVMSSLDDASNPRPALLKTMAPAEEASGIYFLDPQDPVCHREMETTVKKPHPQLKPALNQVRTPSHS